MHAIGAVETKADRPGSKVVARARGLAPWAGEALCAGRLDHLSHGSAPYCPMLRGSAFP